MKTLGFSLVLLLAANPVHSSSQDSDVAGVERAIELYFEAARTHDAELFEEAFDVPNAHLKALRSRPGEPDEVRVVPIRDAIASWVLGEPEPSSGRILSIDVLDGKLATATLEIVFKGRTYVDVMSLYRVSGQWKIVNKVYVSR